MTSGDYFRRKGRLAKIRKPRKAKPLTVFQQATAAYIHAKMLTTDCQSCWRKSPLRADGTQRRPLDWYTDDLKPQVNRVIRELLYCSDPIEGADHLLDKHRPLCRSCARKLKYGE